MPAQHKLLESLKELESDLRLQGVGTCGIVYLDKENVRDEVRRVGETLRELGGVIHYSQNCVDSRFLEGSDYRLETISMTGEVMIGTMVGKLVLPKSTKYRITSKR